MREASNKELNEKMKVKTCPDFRLSETCSNSVFPVFSKNGLFLRIPGSSMVFQTKFKFQKLLRHADVRDFPTIADRSDHQFCKPLLCFRPI